MTGLVYAYRRLKKYPNNGACIEDFKTAVESNRGFVYIAWLETTPYYKIGKSKNPDVRFGGMITLPIDIIIIHSISTNYMERLEKELHTQHKDKRGKGEWFKLTEVDIDQLKNIDHRTYNLGEL
jgi:hypothetical protein